MRRGAWEALVALLLFPAHASPVSAAAAPLYTARHVQGVVLTRAPNAPRWRAVAEGARLVEGQIIQVTSGAAVTIETRIQGKALGLKGDRAQLTLTKPIVARLTSDLLRQVKLSPFFTTKAPAAEPAAAPVADAPLALKDAWERVAAILTGIPPAEAPSPNLAELEREGMALGVSARRLRILVPMSNSVLQTSDWPAELKVVWVRPPGAPRRYLVYAWNAGSARGSPRALSRREFHTVKLDHPGTYFIQVTTADGAWQSPAHVVHAMPPGASQTTSDNDLSRVETTASVTLVYPPEDFILSPQASTGAVTFTWALATPWSAPSCILKVSQEAGPEVRELRTSATVASLTLPPGRYIWTVSQAGSRRQSERRHLEIFDPGAVRTTADRLQVLRRLISGGRSATIAFVGGL